LQRATVLSAEAEAVVVVTTVAAMITAEAAIAMAETVAAAITYMVTVTMVDVVPVMMDKQLLQWLLKGCCSGS